MSKRRNTASSGRATEPILDITTVSASMPRWRFRASYASSVMVVGPALPKSIATRSASSWFSAANSLSLWVQRILALRHATGLMSRNRARAFATAVCAFSP
jgi:hypothetical protein